MTHRFRVSFATVAALFLALMGVAGPSCAPHDGSTSAPAPVPAATIVLVPHGAEVSPRADSRVVAVEVVSRNADRQRGLGGRRTLGEGEGMLFVYGGDRVRSFWMKDCFIGLDIAYLRADGSVVKVATLSPGADAPPGRIPQESSVEPCRYVLEVPMGWFARRGLGAGTRVEMDAVLAGVVPE